MFVIEKNIVHPSSRFKIFERAPWQEMEIGDSFLARDISEDEGKLLCRNYGEKYHRHFDALQQDEGVRIWRLDEKDKEASTVESKVYKIIKSAGEMTEGVIINRKRTMKPDDVRTVLENLIKKNMVYRIPINHNKKGRKTFKYVPL